MSTSSGPEPGPAAPHPAERGVLGVLLLYGLARLGLIALVAGLLLLAGTPLLIATLVALIVALPLSMLVFRGLRSRLDEALAAARARRSAQRAALLAGLRGDAEPGDGGSPVTDSAFPDNVGERPSDVVSGDRTQREPDCGRD
jgi:Protein of unknown function (DUF4229)